MELRQLRSLLAIAEQLHFGRAARVVHLSQPALSKQIRQLEEEIGGALLLRGRHGAKFTALGNTVLDEVRTVVAAADRLSEVCRLAVNGECGTLSLGFGFTALEIVPRAVAAFRRSHPNVEVRLSDISTADQVDALRGGRIQLGVVRLPVPTDLAQEALMADRLTLVVPKAMWKGRCTLSAVKAAPFILLARDRAPGFHAHVLRLCARNGFSPRVVQETNEFHTVLAFVAAGIGVGFVSESFIKARPMPQGVRAVAVSDPAAKWSVGAAWRRQEHDPLVAQFVAALRTQVNRSLSRVLCDQAAGYPS